jgi:hypothetical protein
LGWLADCCSTGLEGLMSTTVLLMAVVAVGTVGCASVPLPADQIAQYEATVDQARAIGAFKLQAPDGHAGPLGMSQSTAHLPLADDALAVARDMAAHGDTRSALLLARAQSDADLAIALACEQAGRGREPSSSDLQPGRHTPTLALCNTWRSR